MAQAQIQSLPPRLEAAAWMKRLAWACGGAFVFGLLAYTSIELTRGSGRIAVVWIPNALAVAFLLRARLRSEAALLGGCCAGNILANLVVGDSPLTAAILASANLVEIWVAVTLVRRWCGQRPDMGEISDLSRFMIAAGLAAPLTSACIANIALFSGGSGILIGIARWAASDALSMLILAPSAMVLWDAFAKRRRSTRREVLEWLAMTTAGTALTLLVFTQTAYPLLFLVPPIVIAHAFQLGTLGTAFSVIKVAAIATVCTALGMGPINLYPMPGEIQLFLLEVFLASSMIVGMPVAAVLSTRERMNRELAMGKQ